MSNPEQQPPRFTAAPGIVRVVDGEWAEVEILQSGCGRCHETGGCGGQNLSQALCSKPKHYRVANPKQLPVGSEVHVILGLAAVRQSATLAYVLPLLALILGAMLGQAVAGELAAILGALLGIVLSWLYLRQQQQQQQHQQDVPLGNLAKRDFRPYIVPRQ